MTGAVNRFINVFVYATSDLHTPLYFVTETVSAATASANGYTSLTNARAIPFPNLAGTGISPELKPIYRLIWRADGVLQAIDTTLDDYRTVSSLPMSAGNQNATASGTAFTPTSTILSTNVQGAIVEVDGKITQENKIINGDFSVAQTGTSFTGGTANADDTYTLDQWYGLTEGSDTVDVTQSTEHPTVGFSYAMDVETTGDKFGLAQILEFKNAKSLIGGNATLNFKAKVSNARLDTIKAAIVSWSGTADTVTSDIISAWGADGTTPTLIANATFENTPADLSVGTDWTDCTVTGAIDTASTANIIVFIWSDNAASAQAGDILYVTDVQLVKGSVAPVYVAPKHAAEVTECRRFFQRYGAPTLSGAGQRLCFGYANSATTALFFMRFTQPFRNDNPQFSYSGTITIGSPGGNISFTSLSYEANGGYPGGCAIYTNNASGMTAGQTYALKGDADGWLDFSARL
jgi:hypothetical protein